MVADTYSDILGWLVMGTGNDNNSWGTNWNSNVGEILEGAIAGKATHAVTGGTLDLSGTPPPAGPSGAVEAIHEFTGILLATQTLIVPNLSKLYFINNKCTGSFGLKVKTTAGTAVNAPAGKVTPIYCDGANGIVRFDREEVGTFVDCGGTTVPGGTFECVGGTVLIADYPDYFAKVGTLWGGNGTTTVGIPNFYSSTYAGAFRRSRTAGNAVGTMQADAFASHNHTASSSAVTASGTTSGQSVTHSHAVSGSTGGQSADHSHSGTTSSDGAHTHTTGATGALQIGNDSAGGSSPAGNGGATTGSSGTHNHTITTGGVSVDHSHAFSVTSGNASADHTHTVTVTGTAAAQSIANTGGTETRPINASVLVAIRY